uniref:START domain-containing protein n=1 Tax=Neobodo designis TaxID=312471 RepID=A0A7S1W7X9_NEODS|mmetsp:Transcript_6461/g.20305  ORF Transcript_6461/g.20305 Transcript_6461/m.20305 type:complete len:371 (+) Transcript_6461:78-1190(+)
MSSEEDVYVESGGQKYKVATLKDFKEFKTYIENNEGWTEKLRKPWITVWIKAAAADGPGAGLNLVKMHCTFPNVEPSTMYDALHDPAFRKSWDDKMKEGYNIVKLDERNDIGYYCAKFPFPMSDRDFLNQRFWMEFDNGEYIIMNRSVRHSSCPEKKDIVRGVSIITGYYLRPLEGGGTELLYITHSDIKGSIPHMVLNSATQRMCPGAMERLAETSSNYEEWAKKNHPPGFKPTWRTPKVSWEEGAAVPTINTTPSPPPVPTENADEEKKAREKAEAEALAGKDLKGQLVELRRRLGIAQSEPDAALHFIDMAPKNSDDPAAAQRFCLRIHKAADAVDARVLEAGKLPPLAEYFVQVRDAFKSAADGDA